MDPARVTIGVVFNEVVARPNDLNEVKRNGNVQRDFHATHVVNDEGVILYAAYRCLHQVEDSSEGAVIMSVHFRFFIRIAHRQCFGLEVNFTSRLRYFLRGLRQTFIRNGNAGVRPAFLAWVFER